MTARGAHVLGRDLLVEVRLQAKIVEAVGNTEDDADRIVYLMPADNSIGLKTR